MSAPGSWPEAGPPAGAAGDGLVHEAVLYRDSAELLAGTVPFVTDGLAAGEPVLVAAPARTRQLLHAALPDRGGEVRMVDMPEAGRNPGGILPAVLLAFAREHRGRPVRIVDEPVWPDRTDEEYPACVQHEALTNAAFDGHGAAVRIRCPYDAVRLAPHWLDAAARTHPLIGTGERAGPSRRYGDPLVTAAAGNLPLAEPPEVADRLAVTPGSLPQLRWLVAGRAAAAGLPAGRAGDLAIAVNELATNSIQHSGGPGTVAIWTTGDGVACQVSDPGHITDPLAGRIPPPVDTAGGGRGLVVVNLLCDLVRVHTRPGNTTVQVRMRR